MQPFRIALCNEVLRELDFARQCALAAQLGYDGLEVAPFTLSDAPHDLPPARIAELRRMAEDAGIVVSGLHWLLIKPDGLSLTDPDQTVRLRTIDVMRRLVTLCAGLGGLGESARGFGTLPFINADLVLKAWNSSSSRRPISALSLTG